MLDDYKRCCRTYVNGINKSLKLSERLIDKFKKILKIKK